ncbi:MAG: adenylyl-sulfate kinase [Gemmatimonadales bacterium]
MADADSGAVVWLTGLSGAGKTTVGRAVVAALRALGRPAELLDGDEIRRLAGRTGFTRDARLEHLAHVADLAAGLEARGVVAVTATISPYREARHAARRRARRFIEVHLAVPLAVCEGRDPKGLYARARAGEIRQFTGIDDPFETPTAPDIRIDEMVPEEAAAAAIVGAVVRRPAAGTDDWLRASLALVAVTDDRVLAGREPVAAMAEAVRGGATMLQVRFKERSARELAALTRELVATVDVPVIVNDRVDVALAAGAAGVHLGADDFPAGRVRDVVPPGFVIGGSVGSFVEVPSGADADYWGIGPLHGTGTKGDAGEPLGLEGFRRLRDLAGGRPCVAIGAVRPADGPGVRAAGGAGVAVVSGIFGAADVAAAAGAYR